MASVETKFSPIVLMIDNETLSTRPNAYITQVGYVVGNVLTGNTSLIRDANLMRPGAGKDADVDITSVRWWMKQSETARKAVFYPDIPPISPGQLFKDLASAIEEYGPGLTVWASPAMFDLPQLTMAWRGKKPWQYNQERDLMTLYKVLDPRGTRAPPPLNFPHVASADALWQFHYLVKLVSHLMEIDPLCWAWAIGS